MLIENTIFGTIDKVAEAIELLKRYEPPEGYYVCFSGGKDSVVILDLVKRAGVKFEAWHNIMTIEPPELMKFIYKEYPDVQHTHPQTSIYKLIIEKGTPPLRQVRYCCWELKKPYGKDRFKVTGVRAEESPRRAKRPKIDISETRRELNLIHDWTATEVWQYIHAHNLPYCKLYDEGQKRIGCIFCPFAREQQNIDNAIKYPQYVKYFISALERAIKVRNEKGKPHKYNSGAEWFIAWIEGGRGKKLSDFGVAFDYDKQTFYKIKSLAITNTQDIKNESRSLEMKQSFSDDLKQRILNLTPGELAIRGVIKLANDEKSYVCPNCGNGTGDTGDGLVYYPDSNTYYCFKCGKSYNNINLLAAHYGLDNNRDFKEILKRADDDFSISDFQTHVPKKQTRLTKTDLIIADIATAQAARADCPKDYLRGLTTEIFAKYNCGYYANWTPIEARLNGYSATPTPRLIIPCGTHYLARLAVPFETFKDVSDFKWIREKQHEGTKGIFGADFITSDTKIVTVTEGEIDAMSIAQAINSNAVTPIATLGAAAKKWLDLFAKKCFQLNINPKVLILFDNDDAGKTNAPKTTDEMIKRGFAAVYDFLSDNEEKLDANNILQQQGDAVLAETVRSLIQKHGDELDKLAAKIDNEKAVKAAQFLLAPEQYEYIFKNLDNTSDLFNAKRLAYLWHSEIRYLSDTDNWANYDADKGIWRVNPNSKNTALNPFVEKTAEILAANAKTSFDDTVVAAFQNQRKYSPAITTMKGNELLTICTEDFNRRKTIVQNFGGKKVAVTNRDLNTHKHLLNCENCVVDLQTGKIYDHSPDFNWTQVVKAEYRAGYHNDIVDTFLHQIQTDEETLEALLLFFGYATTGECCEEKFLFMDGTGGNGKGTLTGLMLHVMNNYGCSFPIEGILMNSKIDANAATPAYNMLEDKRVSISEEIPPNVTLNAAKVKLLTGGDRIPIRRLHQEYSVIDDPTHTMIFSGNNLPEIGDVHDPGILRRLCRIIFKQDFRQNPNLKLKQQLLSPDCRAGFLSVLVEHAQKWYRDGLIVSNEMQKAVQSYIDSQDFISAFIAEHCKFGRNLSIKRKDFLKALQEEYPKETRGQSDQALTKMVEKIDGITYKRSTGGGYAFCGVGWGDLPETQSLIGDSKDDVDVPF